MNSIYQKTISKPLKFEGIGLHSGKKSKITLIPAANNQGVIFKRVDVKQNNLIKASYQNVVSARLCTTLQNENGLKVSTVEHLMAALYVAGIDNVIIEIDNEEVPIMDGSAKIFLEKLKRTETKNLISKRKYLKILDKIELINGNRKISIEPHNSFKVDFQLEYQNKIIGNQMNCVDFENDNLKEVIEARTFCLYEDIEKIKKSGLAKGGSLDNAVVVDNNKVLNKDGLRNKNEFVNHKILDLAGDFLLSGYRIFGKITCYQGGHELSNLFLRKLLSKKICYSIVQADSEISRKKIDKFDTVAMAVSA